MSASAAGTKENPGKKVKQKRGLNRSILEVDSVDNEANAKNEEGGA